MDFCNNHNNVLLIVLLFLWSGCFTSVDETTQNDISDNNEASDYLVVTNVPKDGIPSIDDPSFVPMEEISFLEDDDLIVGVKMGNTIKGYPHLILDRHEIVNDRIDNTPIAITYCPLTGTAIGWHRKINNEVTEFGVSGLLLKNNLVPYDRNTNSNWSQMELEGVQGVHENDSLKYIHLIETTWSTWKKLFDQSEILSVPGELVSNYKQDTYAHYEQNPDLIYFPVENENSFLPNKERIHGIISGNSSKAFQIQSSPYDALLINTTAGDTPIVLWRSADLNLIVSFKRAFKNGQTLEMKLVKRDGSVIMKDNRDNYFNIFGEVVSGPDQGKRLDRVISYNAYWFAWADFYPNTVLRLAIDVDPGH